MSIIFTTIFSFFPILFWIIIIYNLFIKNNIFKDIRDRLNNIEDSENNSNNSRLTNNYIDEIKTTSTSRPTCSHCGCYKDPNSKFCMNCGK